MDLGIERLQEIRSVSRRWGRCGLLCNQASLNKNFEHSIDLLKSHFGEQLKAIFSPQHGLDATVQDNMIETGHSIHKPSGLPIYSLYSDTREPTAAMLEELDTILIDMQIVGCRVYTFKWTIAACLRAAKKHGKTVVVFDRPNPLGGEKIESFVLEKDCYSFVGEAPIPLRHGLTTGELALFVNRSIGAELEVIPMTGWDSKSYWYELKRHWVLTSPNLPTFSAVLFYPGMVLIEGTNLSEGRGTAMPFEQIGAPFIKDPKRLIQDLTDLCSPKGLHLRPAHFEPTSGKWAGQTCGGIHLIATKPKAIESVVLARSLLKIMLDQYEQDFKWKQPPYEYDFVNLPIDLILGSKDVENALKTKGVFDPFWSRGIEDYIASANPILLYEREMNF